MPSDAQDFQPPTFKPPWRIGVDVGGTFTDLVLADSAGRLQVTKVASDPANPDRAVARAIEGAGAALGLSSGALLAQCALFVHGTTVATNTLLQGHGAKVGMLTTFGFRDSLEIRRGIRVNPWDHRTPYPPVLVPRHLRLGIGGRIDARGQEIEQLDSKAVLAAAEIFASNGVEAVAISFLNSFLAPEHERAAAALLAEHLPGVPISLSAEVAPIIGEYERGSTAVLNAYLQPRVSTYLEALDGRLKALGLQVPLLLLQSNGGAATVASLRNRPVNLLLSGPAAGVGALALVARASGLDDLILMEIGGTSCDVTLMAGGRVGVTDAHDIAGYHSAIPSIDIHTVGAGGGTLARVDSAGLLIAGPEGAGARPGPACYGRGGDRPTVTDAQLLLGRMRAGGDLALDPALAAQAIETHLVGPLGLDADRAATGVVALVEQNLLHAVERISIERGRDPRRFTLVAAGGAGPMHGVAVARRMGIGRVYLPRLAGAFCALGLLNADLRQDHAEVCLLPVERARDLAPTLARLTEQARADLTASGFVAAAQKLEPALDLRYRGQQWDVRIALEAEDPLDPAAIRRQFESEYQRLFGHIQPGGTIEITRLRLAGLGLLPPLATPALAAATAPPPTPERRSVHLATLGRRVEIPVYAGASLAPGHQLTGPLLIEEATTTVLVDGEDRLTVDAAGNFLIELAP